MESRFIEWLVVQETVAPTAVSAMHIAKKHQARIVRKTQNPRAPQSAVNLTVVKGIHTMKLHIGYLLSADSLCRQAAVGARAAQNNRKTKYPLGAEAKGVFS